MVDSVEHRVHCHQMARDRRRLGLGPWAATINIKDILNEDRANETDEHAASVANRIAARFRQAVPHMLDVNVETYDAELSEMVENLEDLKADSYANEPSYSVLENLNNTLDDLYDWADNNRYWLG